MPTYKSRRSGVDLRTMFPPAPSVDADKDKQIANLVSALKHAQEALLWHDGLAFEQDGQTVEQVIKSALRGARKALCA